MWKNWKDVKTICVKCRAHCAVIQDAELRGLRARFE